MLEKLIFEKSSPGRTAYSLPECDVPVGANGRPRTKNAEYIINNPWFSPLPERFLRKDTSELPEVA